MNADLRGRVIEKENWNRLVFPGTKLEMSVVVSKVRLDSQCVHPWCRGFTPRVLTSKWITWCVCRNLKFVSFTKGRYSQYCGDTYPKDYQQSSRTYADTNREDLEVFRKVYCPSAMLDHASSGHTTGVEALNTILEEKNRQDSELKRIINTLPTLTDAEILNFRKGIDGVRFATGLCDLPTYFEQRRHLGGFGRICKVLALGQWASEAYWVEHWHTNHGIRSSFINHDEDMSFVIEATLDRDPHELASIEIPLLQRHHESVILEKSFQKKCKEASATRKQSYDYKPILEHHTLQEYILSVIEDSDMRYLIIRTQAAKVATEEEDLLSDRNRLLDALVAEDCPQRNKTLIEILIGRRESYIQNLFASFEGEEESTVIEAAWETLSDPLVSLSSRVWLWAFLIPSM